MIDKKSLKILKILQEKARVPNTEVARQVGLAPSAVLERIRKMENQGIISGYEVRLNPERFDKNQVAFINITTRPECDIDGIIGKKLTSIEEIQEIHFIAGDDSYLIKARVADTKQLHTLLRQKLAAINGVITIKTSTVLATYKETARIPIQ